MPRVTAVLVARNGADYLQRTLTALAAQGRRPDSVVLVGVGSHDLARFRELFGDVAASVAAVPRQSFGEAIESALFVTTATDDEWLWLLGHDNAPEPDALAALLGAVEVAPSVAIAGPKLMRWDAPEIIAHFGDTLTRLGRSFPAVTDELDQAQYDVQSDLLAVAAGGMLVRRSVWKALGGFDSALPSADAALDFSVRARLAGHRVIGVPAARVASAGPAELFGRRSLSAGAHNRIQRAAQLHRRLVWAPLLAVPFHWLSLLPLAVIRSLLHVLEKRPGLVVGEFVAAVAVAFDGTVVAARRGIRSTRVHGWASVNALRMPPGEVRLRQAHNRAAASIAVLGHREGPGFFSGGGAWVVLAVAVIGLIAFAQLASAPAITGGGLLPLSSSPVDLWSQLGYGWREIGNGFTGAADPFSYILAIMGTLTFWSPSFSISLFYFLALPLAAITAWWCAAAFSRRAWAPALAALAWALAPPFLLSLSGGHLAAAIAHILVPSLVLALVRAANSWAMAALAALLFAALAACAPVLVPALIVMLVAWIFARPRAFFRLIGVPIPAAALFAPLIVQQFARGNPLALVAEPGVPVLQTPPPEWQLALGTPTGYLHGWDVLLASWGLPAAVAPLVVVALLAPLVMLALLSPALPGNSRSVPALVIGLMGFVTAVAGIHLELTVIASHTTPIWPGAALGLYWFGLVAGAACALEAFGARAAPAAWFAGVTVTVAVVPILVAPLVGTIAVTASTGRTLPAFVSAAALAQPGIGTLELVPQPDGGLAVTLHRDGGTTLDEQSTLAATDPEADERDTQLATLVGNLASRSGFDIPAALNELQIAFIVLPTVSATDLAEATRLRTSESLNGNRLLSPIGETAEGFLWSYQDLAVGATEAEPGNTGTMLGRGILIGQGVVIGLTILLAIPTVRRRRVRSVSGSAGQPGEEEKHGSNSG